MNNHTSAIRALNARYYNRIALACATNASFKEATNG